MSRNGQIAPLLRVAEMVSPVVGVSARYRHAERIPRHRHAEAQLIYAVAGVMRVETDDGIWVVPPQRAVWVPATATHSIRMTGDVEMRTVYFAAGLDATVPRRCAVLQVGPLMRELVVRIVAFCQPYAPRGPQARAAALLLDEIEAAPQTPLHLPEPSDPRLRRVTAALRAAPAERRSLAEWGRRAGASERTLARLFRCETGMTFAAWRQQLRLVLALERLAAGESVTNTALDLGYESPSAFVVMFRRALGVTPAKYFAAPAQGAAALN